jgi:anti-sigma factor RsiW
MDCRELFALLSQYLDAELKLEACSEIERHLKDCAPCVAFLNTLRKTAELCRQHRPAEAPRPLRQEAREQLRAAYQAACLSKKSKVQSLSARSGKSKVQSPRSKVHGKHRPLHPGGRSKKSDP